MRASADLHIATVVTTNGHADFVVQSTVNGTMRDLVIVSNNGNVGVGSSVNVGIGRLAINGIESGIDTLGLYNSGGAVMVVGDNGGVGLSRNILSISVQTISAENIVTGKQIGRASCRERVLRLV